MIHLKNIFNIYNKIEDILDRIYDYIIPKIKSNKKIIDKFHRIYYDSAEKGGTWKNTYWLGVPILKFPADMWIYQEIIYETKPDIIVEAGTYDGGSAYFLASICDLIGKGKVLTIDLNKSEKCPKHKRIKYFIGSSTSEDLLKKIKDSIKPDCTVMVILDSDHSMNHVLKELRIYSNLVSIGSYLIVEDTNINGHPVFKKFGPGPMEALNRFLRENKNFVIDRSREKFLVSANPRGYLKRI